MTNRARPVVASLVAGLVQRFGQLAGSLIAIPLVLRALGPANFGVWGAAISLLWMTSLVDCGLGNSLVTAIGRNIAANEPEKARTEFCASLILGVFLSVVSIAIGLIAVNLIIPPTARPVYCVAVTILAINIPFSLAAGAWNGLQKSYVSWGMEGLQTILTLSGLVYLSIFSHSVILFVFVSFVGLLISNIFSLSYLLVAYPTLRPSTPFFNFKTTLACLRRGVPYALLALSVSLAIYSDSLLALGLLGPVAAARMAVTQRAGVASLGFLWVITQPLWPAYTHAIASGDAGWIRRNLLRSMVVISGCALGGSAVLVIFGHALLGIWLRGELTLGQDVLWALAAWIVVPAVGRVPDMLLNALGIVWFQVAVSIVYSLLAFGLKFALAPYFGVAGILLASAISYGFTHLPAYLWWLGRWLARSRTSEALMSSQMTV